MWSSMTDRAWLRCDRLCRYLKRWQGSRAWQREVCEFRGLPLAEWHRVWAQERRASLVQWQTIRAAGEPQDFTAYYQAPYFTLRGAWYRRHDTFYTILRALTAEQGTLLDYGCGVGTVGRWLLHRRPGWHGTFVDLSGPSQEFVRWRVQRMAGLRGYVTTPTGFETPASPSLYDVIICLDVFEHLPRPAATLGILLDRLRPGGHLFCSMSPDPDGENIGARYRTDVVASLDLTCETRLSLTATDHYGHYIKCADTPRAAP